MDLKKKYKQNRLVAWGLTWKGEKNGMEFFLVIQHRERQAGQ
jgi:hypothetical protein